MPRRREQLILALLQQPSLEKAAASIGISISTAYRMKKAPEFQNEYLQARREFVSQAIARLQQGCPAAVTTLLKIMLDAGSPTASRVRAADHVLDHAKSLLVLEDQEVRLQRIEQQLAADRVNRERVKDPAQDA